VAVCPGLDAFYEDDDAAPTGFRLAIVAGIVFEADGVANTLGKLSAGLVEQFLGSCFHRFPPLGFDFNRRLPYNIPQIIFFRKGPG
jgi:hypothetical protein